MRGPLVKDTYNKTNHRENYLLSLLNKVTREYKALLALTRRAKPLKITEIVKLSAVPGETTFAIQITYKNCVLYLTAAEIITGYRLNDFNDYQAMIIQQAGLGKLIEFLKLSDDKPTYKIAAKKMDPARQEYIFTIATKDNLHFKRTAVELSSDKYLLSNLDFSDIYDIGYTQGCESIIKEKTALLLAKHS